MADTKPELEIFIDSVIKTAEDCGMVFEQLSDGYYLTEKTTAGDVIQFAMRISNAAARRADAAPSEIAELQRKARAFDWLSEKLSYCETTDGDTHIRKAESTLEEWINEIWESATRNIKVTSNENRRTN